MIYDDVIGTYLISKEYGGMNNNDKMGRNQMINGNEGRERERESEKDRE